MKAKVFGLIEASAFVISSTRVSFDASPLGWKDARVIIDVFRTNGQKLLEHWDIPAEDVGQAHSAPKQVRCGEVDQVEVFQLPINPWSVDSHSGRVMTRHLLR